MTPTEAVINFAYFSANYPRDFVSIVWKGEPDHFIKHIQDKLFRRTFYQFFFELDTKNKRRLVDWVNENYSGGIY